MKSLRLLAFIEFKKVVRNTKALILPVLFYLLALVIMMSFVPQTPETSSFLEIFIWILLSLSIKLSFGSFIHEDAERNLITILSTQCYPISQWLLLKVFISTLVFSGLFMGMFLGFVFFRILDIQAVFLVPVFVGSLLVLQVGIEAITLKTKSARYLSYLLLLPLEIPLFILVVSQDALSTPQLFKTMGGYFMLSIGLLISFSRCALRY